MGGGGPEGEVRGGGKVLWAYRFAGYRILRRGDGRRTMLEKTLMFDEAQARVWALAAALARRARSATEKPSRALPDLLFFTIPACNSNHRQLEDFHSAGDSDDGPEDAIPLTKTIIRRAAFGFHDAVMTL